LAGLGVGLMTPAYQSLISKSVPKELLGTAFGLFSTSLGIISLPAPWIGAQLWAGVNPRFPFMVTGIVVLLSIIPILIKFRLPAKTQEASL
jgi:MFS family permease